MAIIKQAKNINIIVHDSYTHICKEYYKEAEEVIIEATKGDLTLISQKRVVMQGFGKEGKREDEKLEESKLLEIKLEKDTFVPLGIPDFKGNKENDKIKFTIIVKQGTFEKLTFKIKNDDTEIYTEQISKSLKEGDKHEIEWNGFSKDKIYDSTLFIDEKLIAEIKDGTKTSQVKISVKYKEVEWVDVKIDDNSKKVDVTLRVNLKEGKIESSVGKTFADLVLLAQEGLKQYWGRNKTRTIGNSIKINGVEYEVFINPLNTEINSMPALNVYASTTDYGRSRNWWASRKLYYNSGFYPSMLEDIEDFRHTAAHEIGHEILQAFGGKNDYSYIHKGSSTLMTQEVKKSSTFPTSTDEIDLMKYYSDDSYYTRKSNNYYSRNIADEKDIIGLLWCSKLKIK